MYRESPTVQVNFLPLVMLSLINTIADYFKKINLNSNKKMIHNFDILGRQVSLINTDKVNILECRHCVPPIYTYDVLHEFWCNLIGFWITKFKDKPLFFFSTIQAIIL